jgi:hypothetical protein
MALLLLRHTLTITSSDDEDDASAIFSVYITFLMHYLIFSVAVIKLGKF